MFKMRRNEFTAVEVFEAAIQIVPDSVLSLKYIQGEDVRQHLIEEHQIMIENSASCWKAESIVDVARKGWG